MLDYYNAGAMWCFLQGNREERRTTKKRKEGDEKFGFLISRLPAHFRIGQSECLSLA